MEVDEVFYNIYLPGKNQDYIQKKIYEEKIPYEYDMLKDIINRAKKDTIIVDIGSNIGNHSLFLAANGFDVYSFEANPLVFDIMSVSIRINKFDRIKSFNFGLSDKVGKAKIDNFNESNLGGQSLKIGEGEIELKPLDAIKFHKKISVMKIDVEGMEINVLEGAKNTINNNRPLLYIEAMNINEYKKLNNILEELGYVYWDTFNATPTHLFYPKESLSEKDILSNSIYNNISETYRMTQQLNYSKKNSNDISKLLDIISKKMTLLEEELQKLESQKEQWQDTEAEQNKEIIQLQNQKARLESELQQYEEQMEKQKINYISMQERYKNKLQKEETLLSENKSLKNKTNKYKTNFEGIDFRNKRLNFQIEQKENEIENLKNTLSFRWGSRLVKSTKSFNTLLTLPYGLYRDYQSFKKYRKQKTKNTQPVVSKTVKIKQEIKTDLKNLKVAAIMDEFTYNSFKYECELLQITPDNWKTELTAFKPDLVFIESAWKGKDDLWATKISNCSQELVEMIQWCHDNHVQTMFWNKEDPVHFETFVPVAKMVDYVFTTDIDCVPRYKEKVGHDNVQFLPFAAQPAVHNPIELFKRKDAFNFAGSYYLRYPERQRDFASLIDAIKKFKPVEIYDRNFDNPHPHYTFPDEYKPMILGKLPFTEIDKAYKGYRFGINMNTIKQSQSMFARRVFELLASNTVVISNFSRGVRLLFGDLVVSSDNQNQLSTMIEKYCTDTLSYRKLRLLGLRKVMQEHTYAQRLSFIASTVFGTAFDNAQQKVVLFGIANSIDEASNAIESFKKQKYTNKILFIVKNFKENIKEEDNISIFDKAEDVLNEILSLDSNNTYVGQLNPNDYYGENYLADILLSTRYSDTDAFGKGSYYEFNSKIELKNDTKQYLKTNKLEITSSLVKINKIDKNILKRFMHGDTQLSLANMLSIDEFNYCKNGLKASKEELEKYVDDLKFVDKGISFENKLSKIADTLLATKGKQRDVSSLPTVSAEQLHRLFPTPASTKVKLSFSNSVLQIDTKLGAGQHTYIYVKKQFTREELNLVLNSQFELQCDCDIEDIRTVFEFQDKDGQKISHSMNKAGEHHALAIPNECEYIKFGLKLVGNGRVKISKLVLGTHGEVPFAIVGKSKKLVLTKQYPSYDDIYKYGFLHSRIRAYKQEGVLVDIFRINNQPQAPYREFEDIDVATGDNELLEQTLKTGQYDHVLVHLMDENMWKVLEKFIDKIKVTVWVHGAEIQVWQQRDFEFVDMDQNEIDRQKRLSNNRAKFWNYLVSKNYKNLHFVFVSNWLLKSSEEFLKLKFDSKTYSIIHNNIDSNIFDYKEKSKNDRLNILSVRPYAKRVYANDLTVKTVELLSKRNYFNELKFTIIGEGELWEETIAPLKKYVNVTLINKFLQHTEISEYHKKNGILLVPTRMDTQGVSRDEAMSSGLVPVTNAVTAIPEFVDKTCGILAPSEDVQAMADGIEKLYHNSNLFKNMSENAAKRVRSQTSPEYTIKKEIELIRSTEEENGKEKNIN